MPHELEYEIMWVPGVSTWTTDQEVVWNKNYH